jgi:hypothetical protein
MASGTMQIGDVARPPEETCIHVRDSIEQKSGDVRSKMTELHRLETELSAALRQCRKALRAASKHPGQMPGASRDRYSNPTQEKTMKVEIFYFSGCPNHVPAVARVRDVLMQEAADADVVEVEVCDAVTARNIGFLGSPTIRINGQDVEVQARDAANVGLTCRTYMACGQLMGVPPVEWIRAAVKEANGDASY